MSRFPVVLVRDLRRVGSGGLPPCLKYLQGETKAFEQTGILGIKKKSGFLTWGEMLELCSTH